MRLLAWNIRQGGGARLAAIAKALARHEADILVISEYRGGDSASRLRAALAVLGYRHQTDLDLVSSDLSIRDAPPIQSSRVVRSPRIGLNQHATTSKLWRLFVRGSAGVSRP